MNVLYFDLAVEEGYGFARMEVALFIVVFIIIVNIFQFSRFFELLKIRNICLGGNKK